MVGHGHGHLATRSGGAHRVERAGSKGWGPELKRSFLGLAGPAEGGGSRPEESGGEREGKEGDLRGRAPGGGETAGRGRGVGGSVAQVGPAGRAPPGITRAWGGGRTSRRQVAAGAPPAGLAKRARHVRRGPRAAPRCPTGRARVAGGRLGGVLWGPASWASCPGTVGCRPRGNVGSRRA